MIIIIILYFFVAMYIYSICILNLEYKTYVVQGNPQLITPAIESGCARKATPNLITAEKIQ